MSSHFLLQEKFRCSAVFQLIEWSLLDKNEKEALAILHEDPDIYGIFLPVNPSPGLTTKVAYREVALLYLHLQYSNHLPHYFIAGEKAKNNETLVRLVLDNIIEIEWTNRFVGGTDALTALYGPTIFEKKNLPVYLSVLSMDAIRYAWMLDDPDLKSLSRRIYRFNTTPWDDIQKTSFLSKHTVKEFLFGSAPVNWQHDLHSNWQLSSTSEKRGWLSWTRLRKSRNSATSNTKTYKLYISPVIEDMPAVFLQSIPIITDSEAFNFKAGSTVGGLLRPDKMVVYFDNYSSLAETAGILEKECISFHPQGVPFSAQLDKKGILSHGVDPLLVDFPEKIETGSWRIIVCNELALAVLQSKTSKLNWEESIAFISARLLSAGIDINTWHSVH